MATDDDLRDWLRGAIRSRGEQTVDGARQRVPARLAAYDLSLASQAPQEPRDGTDEGRST